MYSAVTICLVPEAQSGPFVFHVGLADGCNRAAALGFDAVEIFPPSAESIDTAMLHSLLKENQLKLAAVGTGAGWLKHKWTFTSDDPNIRDNACQFVRSIIDVAGPFGAGVIVGSMQGRVDGHANRGRAIEWLAESIGELANYAWSTYKVPILIEPLNRYETNIFNRVGQTAQWIESLKCDNVLVLADLFHMNIEEDNIAQAIRDAGPLLGHVHFADSNRQAIGLGHIEMQPAIAALREIGYKGYLSAEVLPLPSSDSAAEMTIRSFRKLTRA